MPFKRNVYLYSLLVLGFITPILKSLVVPVIWLALIDVIYSRIAPFFALNRIFFPGNGETTLKTKRLIRFQGLFKVTDQIAGKWKTEYHVANFATFVSKTLTFCPKKVDEFNFRPAQHCIGLVYQKPWVIPLGDLSLFVLFVWCMPEGSETLRQDSLQGQNGTIAFDDDEIEMKNGSMKLFLKVRTHFLGNLSF